MIKYILLVCMVYIATSTESSGSCKPCKQVQSGPDAGNYLLERDNVEGCSDGCLYKKGEVLYCIEAPLPNVQGYPTLAPEVCPVPTTTTTTTTTTTKTTCDSGWQEFEGSCYILETKKRNWEDASAACQQLHNGAQLTSITNAGENEFLRVLANNDYAYPWTGAHRQNSYWPWTWSDNTSWGDYTNWGSGSGASDCVYMGNGQWFNGQCDWDKTSFCKYSL